MKVLSLAIFYFSAITLFSGCASLKEKRGRLARLMNALRKKHPVVVCEVGDQNVIRIGLGYGLR